MTAGQPDIHDALVRHNPRVLGAVDARVLAQELLLPEADDKVRDTAGMAVVIEGIPAGASALLHRLVEAERGALIHPIPQAAAGTVLLAGPQSALLRLCGRMASAGGLDGAAMALRHALDGFARRNFTLRTPRGPIHLGRKPLVMGILNVTPDSFSDGGDFLAPDAAVAHALRMIEQGADLIDIGGESTRPGSESVSPKEQCRRVVPVIECLAREGAVMSIDTASAAVAGAALDAGAVVINDVTALRGDARMASLAAERDVPLILMHMMGEPRTMQQNPTYAHVVSDVARFLRRAIATAARAGVEEEQIVVDPGIGFGKAVPHNLELTRRLAELRSLGRPILMGFSRKSTVGKVLNKSVEERIVGSLATAAVSVANGAAIVRAHDVAETVDVVRMTQAILEGSAHDA